MISCSGWTASICDRRWLRVRGLGLAGRALLGAALLATPAAATTLRVFLTQDSCNGALGACTAQASDNGVEAANNFCQAEADLYGLSSGGAQFRALLSDATTDAWCNLLGLAGKLSDLPPCGVALLPAAGPWQRLDGIPFSRSLDEIFGGGGPISSAAVDPLGAVLGIQPFFTGTSPSGTGGAADCDNWLDGTGNESAVGGTSDATSPDFFYGAFAGCDSPRRLLCFEVGAGDPLHFPSEAGALAFVTSETGPGKLELWASSGGAAGVAGADAVCELRATLAGLPFPESFVAWLSDDSVDAGSRLTISGPWERVDGVPIASSFGDLVDGSLFTPLGLTEWGAKLSGEPWTGTETSGIQSGADCLDWTSDGNGADGTSGRSYKTGNAWTQSSPETCDGNRPIYCFSNQVLLGWDAFETGDLEHWSAVVGGP